MKEETSRLTRAAPPSVTRPKRTYDPPDLITYSRRDLMDIMGPAQASRSWIDEKKDNYFGP